MADDFNPHSSRFATRGRRTRRLHAGLVHGSHREPRAGSAPTRGPSGSDAGDRLLRRPLDVLLPLAPLRPRADLRRHLRGQPRLALWRARRAGGRVRPERRARRLLARAQALGRLQTRSPRPRRRAARFDLVYVDGSHRGLDVLVDAALSWPLLEVGGVVVFDDYRWALLGDDPLLRPGPAIDAFVSLVSAHGEVISHDRQVALRKLD